MTDNPLEKKTRRKAAAAGEGLEGATTQQSRGRASSRKQELETPVPSTGLAQARELIADQGAAAAQTARAPADALSTEQHGNQKSSARQAEADSARPAPSARPRAPSATETALPALACSHLGLENDPFSHRESPSSEHRCYLWMQRDRIDLAHQEMFCLTGQSERCPWLSISSPRAAPPLHRRAAQRITTRLTERFEDVEDPWQRNLLVVLSLIIRGSSAAWRVSQPVLLQLGLWLLVGLRLLRPVAIWPVLWLSRHYRAIERSIWQATLGRLFLTRPAGQRAGPVESAAATPGLANASPEMAEATAQLYLQRGLEAMQDGDTESALRRFRLATASDLRNEQAWLLRGAVAETPEEKAECLRAVLSFNPNSERARVGLIQLGASAGAAPSAAPRALGEEATLVATWTCADCGAMNTSTAKTCERCGRPSPRLERDIAAAGDGLLGRGLAAMRAGSEELAYHYFSLAAESEPDNEQAWYWRAKTAPGVAEVIHCLRQIVAINPANAKAQADLAWALQRQQRELTPPAEKKVEAVAHRGTRSSQVLTLLRQGLLQLASVSSFLLALMFGLPYAVSLTDWATVPEFQSYLALLPSFKLPAMLVEGGNFDLGPAVPLALALLLLHAAFSLGDGGGKGTRVWTAILSSFALVVAMFYVSPVSLPGPLLALTSIVTSLAGRAPAEEPRVDPIASFQ